MNRKALGLFGLAFGLLLQSGPLRADALPSAIAAAPQSAQVARAAPQETASYTLSASLDTQAHVVTGQGTIRFRNLSSVALTEIWLHLYLNAFKNESSVFFRDQLGGFRGGVKPKSWGAMDVTEFALGGKDLWPQANRHTDPGGDETEASVPLPTPLAPGEEVVFSMKFRSQLPSVVERTGFADSFHMVGQWFPKIAKLEPTGEFAHFTFHHLAEFYADFGNYDVTIDVPKGYRVAATGPRLSETVSGERQVVRHVQDRVHDFAFAVWDRFETSETVVSDGSHDVRVLQYYPKGYEAMARRELKTMQFALPHFGQRYGSYPYDVISVVHPPDGDAGEAGGMEYPTLITTGGPVLAPFDNRPEVLTIHEFGHQYFFGILASNEAREPFLDEGLNSYAEAEALRVWKGEASGGAFGFLKVSLDAISAARSREAGLDEKVAKPASQFSTGGAYGRLVYARTATIVETAARVYGRALVEQGMRDYALRFRFRHPTAKDWLSVMGEHLGAAAQGNLEKAFFSRSTVDYAVLRTVSGQSGSHAGLFDNESGTREEKTSKKDAAVLTRVVVTRRGELVFPVDVRAQFEDGSEQHQGWDAQTEVATLTFASNAKLRQATMDPEHKVLLDTDVRNNTRGPKLPRLLENGYVASFLEALWPGL
jgi:Peptidase family M1 domain